MRRIGEFLMKLGLAIGILVALAAAAHLGIDGVPWLVNVALAKLGFIAAGGLITGGAVSVRIARRQEQQALHSSATKPPSLT